MFEGDEGDFCMMLFQNKKMSLVTISLTSPISPKKWKKYKIKNAIQKIFKKKVKKRGRGGRSGRLRCQQKDLIRGKSERSH